MRFPTLWSRTGRSRCADTKRAPIARRPLVHISARVDYGVVHRARGRRDTAMNPTAKSESNSALAENTIASVGLPCSSTAITVGDAAEAGADCEPGVIPRAASRASGERRSRYAGAGWFARSAARAASRVSGERRSL